MSSDVIVLVGPQKSGVDTVADLLVKYYGYTKLSLWGKTKECVKNIGTFLGIADVEEDVYFNQIVSSELIRECVDHQFWVKDLEQRMQPGGKYVITDIRYVNEYYYFQSKGYVFLYIAARFKTLLTRGKAMKSPLNFDHKSEELWSDGAKEMAGVEKGEACIILNDDYYENQVWQSIPLEEQLEDYFQYGFYPENSRCLYPAASIFKCTRKRIIEQKNAWSKINFVSQYARFLYLLNKKSLSLTHDRILSQSYITVYRSQETEKWGRTYPNSNFIRKSRNGGAYFSIFGDTNGSAKKEVYRCFVDVESIVEFSNFIFKELVGTLSGSVLQELENSEGNLDNYPDFVKLSFEQSL